MPRIFDNIERSLLPALKETLVIARRADFCVGYFNLRGWRHLADHVDTWTGDSHSCCRLLVGMHVAPSEQLRQALREQDDLVDNQTAIREKKRIAEEFRAQLQLGVPTDTDEATLRHLARQLRAGRLVIKVFLAHPLHAKLYLLHREDPINPVVAYLGSSNLTLAGLAGQGELNIDVLDGDACIKLVTWFEDRWGDRWCIDISKELAELIEVSWASEQLIPPFHIYLKMAYHLAQEARTGLSEFRIPAVFGTQLFDFQVAAVKIAAHHLHKRGGVLIGDVVGLGKSMMATALAKIFEDDFHTETLILCPKNLVPMWEDYAHSYRLHAKVLSISKAITELPEKTRRFRVVLIDESHNLRNREGKRYKAIRSYIERNESLCILLSATPYNKTYLDLSTQLSLFLKDDEDIGIRPEKLIAHLGGEHEFVRRHQCSVRSLKAFEQSTDSDDWRDLMRLYMVRRTRGFIMQHYAIEDPSSGRRYLQFSDGRKSYFPNRIPRNVKFHIKDGDPADQYGRFYSDRVVGAIGALILPRYGLANYVVLDPINLPTPSQERVIQGLSRAGNRLMGFCRTNLFKRLESAGPAFLTSLERHVLRNFVMLHALENNLDVPLGSQSAEYFDSRYADEDADDVWSSTDEEDVAPDTEASEPLGLNDEDDFRRTAGDVYKAYSTALKSRFKWLPAVLFRTELLDHLLADARALIAALQTCGEWDASRDAKLRELINFATKKHRDEKLLVFTQFADTARYLRAQLRAHGVSSVEAVTGESADPTMLAWRFSPVSNGKRSSISQSEEIRVLIATDILSEGQNLQDCAVVVNYDLPWAIIRLIQRAGRVDRIGQQADEILCYSFVPADGVERLIRLRARVRQRLDENREVVGSDESFFDDDRNDNAIRDLYTEKSGILDGDSDTEVDLASYAYQIWKDATDNDPSLAAKIEALPNVVLSTKAHSQTTHGPKGVLVYMRTAAATDALAWIDETGTAVTQSQLTILKGAACEATEPALQRRQDHHTLTLTGVRHLLEEERSSGGALGRPSGARFKAYERIKRHRDSLGARRDLFITDAHIRAVDKALEELYRFPLYQSAADTLNRQLKAGIDDHAIVELVLNLREDGRLVVVEDADQKRDPQLICTMGLA